MTHFLTTKLVNKMSWLWKDKKTEQLKSILAQGFEDDKKTTTGKLSAIKKETLDFRQVVKEAFSNSRITQSLKHKKHIIDGLEDKVTQLQEKMAQSRHWNFNQLKMLEEREHNLESCLMEVTKKNEEMVEKTEENAEKIRKLAEELTCEQYIFGLQSGPSSTRVPSRAANAQNGPPTSGSKQGGRHQRTKPCVVTGWSTDDERIFDREAAKINLKWKARLRKNRHQSNNTNPLTDWWHTSEKLRNEFLHKVWDATSGSVNTLEAVERHAQEWIKVEDTRYKKRQKVQKWREAIIKEKEDRLKKIEVDKFNVQECKECESKIKKSQNKEKIAEWKQLKAMKDELKNAQNLIETVHRMEENVANRPKAKKKLGLNRPKSAKNMLISRNDSNEAPEFQPQLIEEFQKRDAEQVNAKMALISKSKSTPNLKNIIKPKWEKDSTLMNPTISSTQKHPEPIEKTDFDYTDLELKLMQIDHVPKLGLPVWRVNSSLGR